MISYAKFNKGFRYISVVNDIFGTFVWVEPVKQKQGKEIPNARNRILSMMSKAPIYFDTDNEKKFHNHDLKELMERHQIHHFSSFTDLKASAFE